MLRLSNFKSKKRFQKRALQSRPVKRSQAINTNAAMEESSPRISYVEVERKFYPSASLDRYLNIPFSGKETTPNTYNLRSGSGYNESIKQLEFMIVKTQMMRDVYYDKDDQLSKQGIWIRKRTTWHSYLSEPRPKDTQVTWEAKCRTGGDYINSQFDEIEGEEKVRALVEQVLPGTTLCDLDETADIQADRKTWRVCEKSEDEYGIYNPHGIYLVLDHATAGYWDEWKNPCNFPPFKHSIGELEMTREVVGGCERGHENKKRIAREEMDKKLDEFMQAYPALFPTDENAKGKLSAYFAWQKRNFDSLC